MTYQIGPVIGVGRTKTEARADAERAAAQAMNGEYRPVILTRDGHTALVWRTPFSGWQYHIIAPGQTDNRMTSSSLPDPRRIWDLPDLDPVKAHLVQNTWTPDTDDNEAAAYAGKRGPEILSWCKWQRRMRELMDSGMSMEEARYFIDYGRPRP